MCIPNQCLKQSILLPTVIFHYNFIMFLFKEGHNNLPRNKPKKKKKAGFIKSILLNVRSPYPSLKIREIAWIMEKYESKLQ